MVSFLVTFSGGQGGWGRNIVSHVSRSRSCFLVSVCVKVPLPSAQVSPPGVAATQSGRALGALAHPWRQPPPSRVRPFRAPGPLRSGRCGSQTTPVPPSCPPTPPGSSFGRPPGLAVVGVCGVSPSEAFRGLGLSPEEGAPPCFMLTALVTAHKPSCWSARPLQRLRGGGAGAWRPAQRRLPWHTAGVQQQQA